METLTIFITLLPLGLLFRTLLFKISHNKHKKLPSGPKGFLIFGSLHLLGKFSHRNLHRLSQKYGPIMHVRLGLKPTIIVSSPDAAHLFLKTYDHIVASRPLTLASNHMSYGQKNLGFAEYGSYWRNMRKICTIHLLSNLEVTSFRSMRREELALLIEDLRGAAKNHVIVDLSSRVSTLSADMSCLMMFGKKYAESELDERGFKGVIQEAFQLLVAPNLGGFIPCVAALDLQRLKRRTRSVSKIFDGFFEKVIDEHLEFKHDDEAKDFVDVMLELMGSQDDEYQIDRSNIKAIILDMLTAMDTSATIIGWALSELIKHPQVMKKMQDELKEIVGLDRMVEETDVGHLKYLDMVIKEILMLHPLIPLLVPHQSLED